MITRIWHGKTRVEDAEKYLRFLLNKGTEGYRNTAGNRSIRIWQSKEKDACHFYTVTEWNKLDEIKSFAGNDYQKAVYYPEDDGVLLEFEEFVNHHETYDVSNTKITEYINQLTQIYSGGSWQGESYAKKLIDIDDEKAFGKPFEAGHSIAELIWHSVYWKMVLIERMEGNQTYRDETIKELNFLPEEKLRSKGGWNWLRNEFETINQQLIDLLKERNDSFLREEYTTGYAYNYLVEGIVQHYIYHLGQIGLIKKIVLSK